MLGAALMCKDIQRKLEEEKAVKLSAVFHVLLLMGVLEVKSTKPSVRRG